MISKHRVLGDGGVRQTAIPILLVALRFAVWANVPRVTEMAVANRK